MPQPTLTVITPTRIKKETLRNTCFVVDTFPRIQEVEQVQYVLSSQWAHLDCESEEKNNKWGRRGVVAMLLSFHLGERGRSRIFACENRDVRCDWSAGPSMVQRLERSPPTNGNRVRFLAGSLPDFRAWEFCRTMPLVGGFSRGFPVSPTLAFRRCSILNSLHPFRISRAEISPTHLIPVSKSALHCIANPQPSTLFDCHKTANEVTGVPMEDGARGFENASNLTGYGWILSSSETDLQQIPSATSELKIRRGGAGARICDASTTSRPPYA
ncbi:hypothetical protein PR048_013007 [Dryococelus australis]|uniref:Uncharacterized protein n=1 Tax=Dryococelus australis TaxID=614101 RepID=A0ABQ9HRP0_9NEOP|nr:hypothetical protein PR048_013007 [Dryococelus australis]